MLLLVAVRCVARAGLMRCAMVMAGACCARVGCVAGGTDVAAAGSARWS